MVEFPLIASVVLPTLKTESGHMTLTQSSMVAPEAVGMTTNCTTSDNKVGTMAILGFQ